MAEVTVGDLLDWVDKDREWVVLSYQEGLDEPEVIGTFQTRKDAQVWSSEHFDHKTEIRHFVARVIKS
jgi:hypothetical protein